jgi:glutamate formiminotransferase/formiminotetrahydrofolate cyclodeaminase
LIRIAVQTLGLAELAPFKPEEKIIESRVAPKGGRLMERKLNEFLDELSSDSPAPGGGSVAALGGACAAALAAMVANLTVGKKGYEPAWEELGSMAEKAQALKDRLSAAADQDTAAFNRVMEAFRLPKGTPEEKTARKKAIESATQAATLVPLETLRQCVEVLPLAKTAAEKGNRNSLSDAGVAASFARAAGRGAYLNVRTNLNTLFDTAFVERTAAEAKALLTELEQRAAEIEASVQAALENPAA